MSSFLGDGGWTAETKNEDQYLTIDLVNLTSVTGVGTQGRYDTQEYTLKYKLQHSQDGDNWETYMENGQEKVREQCLGVVINCYQNQTEHELRWVFVYAATHIISYTKAKVVYLLFNPLDKNIAVLFLIIDKSRWMTVLLQLTLLKKVQH